MKNYINLDSSNIEFKHLISGPAPIGRILNYILLTGQNKLYHKNGNRDLNLTNNIASAWCSEFMVGLGLVYYNVDKSHTEYKLYLTDNGQIVYDFIKNYNKRFDEDNEENCKIQLKNYSIEAYEKFKDIFMHSPVYKNLVIYIENNSNKLNKDSFFDNYYEEFLWYYKKQSYNRDARTPTGQNRVPSLLQICKFFDIVSEENNYYIFTINNSKIISEIKIDTKILEEINTNSNREEIIIKDIINNYGIDGNIARELIVRNSSIQHIFRNNLIAKYGCKCSICEKKIESILVASHIYPSSLSNAFQKVDYENGLLLCPLHDKLFDKYFISFQYINGHLMYNKILKGELNEYQLKEHLILEEKFMTNKRKKYLEHHNNTMIQTFSKENIIIS